MPDCTTLTDVGIIAVENNRSRAYLQRLEYAGLRPAFAILLQSTTNTLLPGQTPEDLKRAAAEVERTVDRSRPFELHPLESVRTTLLRTDVPLQEIPTADINDGALEQQLKLRPERIWIFSGPGGAIVRRPLFATGKMFLHVHPGLVPEYRGSTTLYYSLLQDDFCGASAIFLGPQIDTGDIIATKCWPPPVDRRQIDYLVDPLLRSELLVDVLCDYMATGNLTTRPQPIEGHTYYIIHPVLKHLAILGSQWRGTPKILASG